MLPAHDTTTVRPGDEPGVALYDLFCAILGVSPALVRDLDARIRTLPAPCCHLRIELGLIGRDATLDTAGAARPADARGYAGGYDARPYHHAAPHVRVAFCTSNPNYGRARNDAERLAHFAYNTTAPALSGANGLGTALTDLATRLVDAIKLAQAVPYRNDRTVAARNNAVREAGEALRGIRAFASALRETGALPPLPDAPASALITITPEPLQ